MGWTSGPGTIADRIEEQTRTWHSKSEATGGDVTVRTIAHCWRAPILWSVIVATVDATGAEHSREIGCTIIQRCGRPRQGFDADIAVKCMSESVGPCYYSCPLKYLDMVPEPAGPYAAGWRDKVRAWHARQSRKLAIGERYALLHCTIPDIRIRSLKPLYGEHGGRLYRVKRQSLGAVLAD